MSFVTRRNARRASKLFVKKGVFSFTGLWLRSGGSRVSRCVGVFAHPLETANPLIRCASGIGTSQEKSLSLTSLRWHVLQQIAHALQAPKKVPVLLNVFDVRELASKNKFCGSGKRKTAQQAS
jgi:hypothetical protein